MGAPALASGEAAEPGANARTGYDTDRLNRIEHVQALSGVRGDQFARP